MCVASGVGKVAAAMAATELILRYNVEALLITGIAGAIKQNIAVGDLVLGNSVIQYDVDARPLFSRFEVPFRKSALFLVSERQTSSLRLAMERACSNSDKREVNIHQGLIGSADCLLREQHRAKAICNELPELLCVDMESAAVAQVAEDYQVNFLVFRIISDQVFQAKAPSVKHFVSDYAAPLLSEIVKNFVVTLQS